MELMDAIKARRSVRQYEPRPVERTTIEQLLQAAGQAPSAVNTQPWAFGVIEGVEVLREYSARAKEHLLRMLPEFPHLARFQDMLSNPDYNLFYDAPALVIIYAKPAGLHAAGDCCLAAQNLMLAACDQGLGTCWIGFSQAFFDQSEVKAELGVPSEYQVVAPLIVGYPDGPTSPVPRDPPEVVFWQ